MDTSQIVIERTKLEASIREQLNSFQKKTGMRVDYIGVDRPFVEQGQSPAGAQVVAPEIKSVSVNASLA